MLIEELSESSQPTKFPRIIKNANRIFGAKKVEGFETGFYYVQKDNPSVRSERYDYESRPFLNSASLKNEFKQDAKQKFKDAYNLRSSQVELVSIFPPAIKPADSEYSRVIGNQLQTNQYPTYSQQVANKSKEYKTGNDLQSIKQLTDMGVITVANVKKVIDGGGVETLKSSYEQVLDSLIDTTGNAQGFTEPKVIVDNISSLGNVKFNTFLTDFLEVASPIGLICGTVNGNANRLLPYFFSVDKRSPAKRQDIIKNSTVHFHPSPQHKLVDSYIEYRGQVLRVSHKFAVKSAEAGQGASFSALYQSLTEIASNSRAREEFNRIISDRRFKLAFENLLLLSDIENAEKIRVTDIKAFLKFLTVLENSKKYKFKQSDRNIMILLGREFNNNEEIELADWILGLALGSDMGEKQSRLAAADDPKIKRVIAMLSTYNGGKFSEAFKQLVYTFDINKWGEATTTRGESHSWWYKIQIATIYAVANVVNADPAFSSLATWILNHGRVVQIDSRAEQQNNQVVLSNIVATWPSTNIDSVYVNPSAVKNFIRWKLVLNAENSSDIKKFNDLKDDDFGFERADTVRNLVQERLPQDLAKTAQDWEQIFNPESAKKTRAEPTARAARAANEPTRAATLLAKTLEDLKNFSQNYSDPKKNIIDLVKRIVPTANNRFVIPDDKIPDLEKIIVQSLKNLSFLNPNNDHSELRQQAINDLKTTESLLVPVYHALWIRELVNRGKINTINLKTNQEFRAELAMLNKQLRNLGSTVDIENNF